MSSTDLWRSAAAARVLLCLLGTAPAQACEHQLVRLASADGPVEMQRAGDADWRSAAAGEVFCDDVSVRVGEGGSAALELANQTLLRLSGLSAVSIRRQPNAAVPAVRMERGRGHFLSRTRQRFNVSTPYLNAALTAEDNPGVWGVGMIEPDDPCRTGAVGDRQRFSAAPARPACRKARPGGP